MLKDLATRRSDQPSKMRSTRSSGSAGQPRTSRRDQRARSAYGPGQAIVDRRGRSLTHALRGRLEERVVGIVLAEDADADAQRGPSRWRGSRTCRPATLDRQPRSWDRCSRPGRRGRDVLAKARPPSIRVLSTCRPQIIADLSAITTQPVTECTSRRAPSCRSRPASRRGTWLRSRSARCSASPSAVPRDSAAARAAGSLIDFWPGPSVAVLRQAVRSVNASAQSASLYMEDLVLREVALVVLALDQPVRPF